MTDAAPAPARSGSLFDILTAADFARPALAVPEDGAVVTFGALAERVDALAQALAGLGAERGDRVCLALPNGPEIVELLFAITALGGAAAPLNPGYTEDEYAFYLDDLRPKLFLLPEGEAGRARSAAATRTSIVDVRTAGGRTVLPHAPTGSYTPAEPADVAILLHTSGTTSRPKQVPLLQRNLVASATSMARHYELSDADVSCVAMPLFHVHGLVASTLAALAAGGTVVVPRRLAPGRFRGLLAEHGVTWFSAGPTIHRMLLDRSRPSSSEGLRLRFTRSCSSPLTPDLMAAAESSYGVPMLEAYGMTEASHEMTANPLPPAERRPGTVGIPTGAEVRVVDEEWNSLPEGTPGEVTVRGPGLTPGYLENPRANAAAFRDGWFRTGDQGVVEGGYLRLTGRLKELIIRGGENISPAEVEEALKQHTAVTDAAVFGRPDDKYGEVVEAAVALDADADADERALIEHCRTKLTSAKVPRKVHLLHEIPRTPTGKLQRRRVAEAIYGEE